MVTLDEVLTKAYVVIEKILPILLPFMTFVLPPIVALGQFMRIFIGDFLYPFFPLDSAFQNLIPWYIIGGILGVGALISLCTHPDRPEKDELD